MDAEQAIADLTEISPQVRDVVVVAADGSVAGSNAVLARAEAIARAARQLLASADEIHGSAVAQVEAALSAGSLFAVRDGGRTIAATTSSEPTVGLVFYDLKTCLRSVDEPKPPSRRKAASRTDDAAA